MIFKNSLLIGLFSIFSVLLGIVRDRLLATVVGIGSTLDVYNAAFRIPDFLYSLALAFVTSATVVPFLTVENKHGVLVDARHKLSSAMILFLSVISFCALVIAISLPLYASLIVPGFTFSQREEFIFVTRILLLQPIFLGITSIISCFAQLKNHFLLYGIAPLGYSIGIIIGILFLFPVYGVQGLVYGVLLGACISFAIQLFSLRGSKMSYVFPYFSFADAKELLHIGLPRTGVNVLTQIRTIIFTAVATTLGPGVLSSYLFAQRVIDALVQVIQQSITTASIPVLSKEYVERRIKEYKHLVRKYVMILGGVGILVSGAVYLFRDMVVALLYGNTSFNWLIVFFLTGLLCALPFHMMIGYFSISFYAMKDTKSVLYANSFASLASVLILFVTATKGSVALIYGIITMSSVNFLLLFFLYSRKRL